MSVLTSLQKDLHSLDTPERAKGSTRFFKTGAGQYGEGDVFIGVTVPETRALVKKYAPRLTISDVEQLLSSKFHEERLVAVLTLVYFVQNKTYPLPQLGQFYLDHVDRINNWDLIDSSSEYVIGPYLETLDHPTRQKLIDDCINSENLWLNRIIILASFHQLKKGNEKLTFYIAEKYLNHKHDLIHKATGWLLREVGKRIDEKLLTSFLDQHASQMPRTMLRYAIERLPVDERQFYLHQK